MSKYTQYITTKKYDIENELQINKLEKEIEFIKLRLENKVNHYEQSIRIINAEKRMLEKDNEWLKSLTITFATRSSTLMIQQLNDIHNHSKLINNNENTINNVIDIQIFRQIFDLIKEQTGNDETELSNAIDEVEQAASSNKRSLIGAALSKFAGVLTNTIDKAHIFLVDAPEVIEKLKAALSMAKKVADTGHYTEVAKMLNNIIHML